MVNTNAIDKIIAELAYKDYLQYNPRNKDGRPIYKKHHAYTLSDETNEARQIRNDYISGMITEKEYKSFCLKYNLLTR